MYCVTFVVGFLPAGFGPIDSTPVKKPIPKRGQAHGANIPMITELGKYQSCVLALSYYYLADIDYP